MNKISPLIQSHYEEVLTLFPERQIVGLFLQGSQNYGLDNEQSDVDTKLLIVPTLDDLAMNRKPISTTYIRDNNEHIDIKDIRLYIQLFRKQNLNFIEILFTNYYFVNPIYEKQWNLLRDSREDIAYLNPYRSIKSMAGVAMEKYHAMTHEYPSRVEVFKKYNYDPKQLHHLIRILYFIQDYYEQTFSYEKILKPIGDQRQVLMDVKNGKYSLYEALILAEGAKDLIDSYIEMGKEKFSNKENQEAVDLLNNVQYNIIKQALREEVL